MSEARADGQGLEWWQRGIVYQIYPRSFQDSDGDGIGDLAGINRRLDYLAWLGVDAIWVSPFYPSPMKDFGYDVADYRGVDSRFGTMADFDALIGEAHARGLKLILDFVPNHSSDQHPWFQESRASRSNPKRDWYIWRDPAPNGSLPNNWLSNFGGPGWSFDGTTGQYYYHAFLAAQPDLNWRNPQVRREMADAMRFWLDKGVDGFRIDVLWHLMKDPLFRDNPVNPEWQPGQPEIDRLLQRQSCDHPDIHKVVAELRDVVDAYDERVLVGEIYLPVERLVAFYGEDQQGVHLPFNFQLIFAEWTAQAIARIVREYEAALPEHGWPNWVLSNHDQKRIATRIGQKQTRIAAMLLLTLRGTPTLYYADELGLENVDVPPDRVQDPWEKNEGGFGRDPARTPMPWSAEHNAGFSSGEPWLPLNEDCATRNVEALKADPGSILNLYQRLIALRGEEAALQAGSWSLHSAEEDVLAYCRSQAGRTFLVALNFSGENRRATLPGEGSGRLLLSSALDRHDEAVSSAVQLRPHEGVIVALA